MTGLAIEDVGVRFGGLWANKGVSFTAPGNSITGLIGPNGAGKSTLFNVITGFIKPTEGRVRMDDTVISGRRPERIARLGVGRTFQIPEVCGDLSLVDNVLAGAHRHIGGGLVGQVLGLPGARHSEHAAIAHTEELIGAANLWFSRAQLAQTLPLGKIRLLEICRALASKPTILLLDEAASGLNSAESRELIKFIEPLPERGIAVVLIEHNMHFVMELARQIAVLNFGNLIAFGTPADIRRDPAVVSAYLGTGGGDARN